MNQSDTQNMIHQLKIRFEKMPRKCKKRNDSYIGQAQRIVCVNDGTFYYYPKIQQFQDLDFDKLQYVVPKAGIKLEEILQLRFPPRRTNQRNYFSIIIPKNKILKFAKTLKKEMVVDEKSQGQQIWTFQFNFDIITLPQRELRQAQSLLKLQQKQKQHMEELIKLKQKQEKQQKFKIQQEYNSLLQAQQLKVNQNDDYARKRLQLNERQLKEKQLKESDELFFSQIYKKILYSDKQYIQEKDRLKDEQIAALQIKLLQVIGNFRERAQQAVKQFIDQWPYNLNPIKKNTYYEVSNLNVKFGDKNLNQQFLSNKETAYSIMRNKHLFSKQFRVPLMAFIKYKGFKIIVRSITPIDRYDPKEKQDLTIHGNCIDTWKSNFLAMENLFTITQDLKLKPYNSQVHYQKVQIHLGTTLKVIETKQNPFRQLMELDKEKFRQNQRQKIVYLYDIDQIFPIDLDLQNNINQANIRLRPQFVATYIDKQLQNKTRLSGGGLLYMVQDQEGQKQDVFVAKASQHLKFVTLYNFVKNLDNLKFIPYNSESYSNIMKDNGINMRYLGLIIKATQLPYIKVMTQIQCIARIVKNIYRDCQYQFCISNFRENEEAKKLIQEAYSNKSALSLKKMRLKQLKNIEYQQSIVNAIDFLNMLFGVGKQTLECWEIISYKIKAYYDFQISNYLDLPQGYLLTSILYHCGFQIKITDKTALFLQQKPFKEQDWIKFSCKIQSFDFPSLKVYSKTQCRPQFSDKKNKNRLQMNLLIKRSLKKSQTQTLINLSKYTKNFQPKRQKYSIENVFYYFLHPSPDNFDTALKVAHFMLPSSHPLFIQLYLFYANLKSENLDVISLKKAAQIHSIRNLGITHWKTSQILSNFKQIQFLDNLKKAEIGVADDKRTQLYLKIAQEQINLGRLIQCSLYVKKCISLFQQINLTRSEISHYCNILLIGIRANYQMRRIQELLKVSEYMWLILEKYWTIQYIDWFQKLLNQSFKCFLESNPKKYYLYKLVLVLQEDINHDFTIQQRKKILLQTYQKSKQSKNHINWIKQFLIKLEFGFSEINFRTDFFTKFWQYAHKLQSQDFDQGLKQLHDLIHIFGKEYFEEALLNKIYCFETTQKKKENVSQKNQKQKASIH